MKILVLYEELAWYFINCMNTVAATYNCEVLIICKASNDNAPFNFHYVHPKISIKTREQFTYEELLGECKRFAPTGIFTGGWSYKPYLKLIKELKPATSVIGFDNHWTGTLKQKFGSLYFKWKLKPLFDFAFVPGTPQFEFAEHLGFDGKHIAKGVYCCDHALFTKYFQANEPQKAKSFPKRFLYVGRYASEKGVKDLWSTFIEWQNEKPNEWELWCAGKGELTCPPHPKIKHFGFVQPNQLGTITKDTGVFILPSTFEPWGVVVHEYAAAGFPLLCSSKIGAAETFLENGKNGYVFEAGDREQLKEKMNTFSTLNEQALLAMSRKSAELSARVTPEKWAADFAKMYGL